MKLRRLILTLACTVATAAVLGSAWWVVALGPVPKAEDFEVSTQVVDREGRLLRAYATTDGRWRLPAALDGVDHRYVEMLLTYEDKRFREHRGVDPWALARAAQQWIASKPVSYTHLTLPTIYSV